MSPESRLIPKGERNPRRCRGGSLASPRGGETTAYQEYAGDANRDGKESNWWRNRIAVSETRVGRGRVGAKERMKKQGSVANTEG